MSNIEKFQKLVLKDITLQDQLKTATDFDSFARLAVKIGKQVGYDFTVADIKTVSSNNKSVKISRFSALNSPSSWMLQISSN